MPRRLRLQHRADHRGTHRILFAVRAPRAPVPRPRLHRLHRARRDHRHLQVDQARARLRPPVHGPGASWGRDRRRAGPPAAAARCRRAPERAAPMHPDAWRARSSLADLDLELARQLRKGSPAQDRVPPGCDESQRPLTTTPVLAPFSVLIDEAERHSYDLPEPLSRTYGRLGFGDRVVYSNFVSSLDGVATFGSGISAGSAISGKYPADRFLMALLRACADAVVIGAGTLRATPGHLWTPAHVYPDLAMEFAVLRITLDR